jgi:hypothetical protein
MRVDVKESQWGTIVPTAAASNETNIFLAGVDTKNYGRLKSELNNACMAGQNNYPKMVESAVMTILSHYMNDKEVHMTDEDKGQTVLKSFMQKHKNVTCYRCGSKKGQHYPNECPDGHSDDESSTRSSLSSHSNNSRPSRIAWNS